MSDSLHHAAAGRDSLRFAAACFAAALSQEVYQNSHVAAYTSI
jgi:hypothetical protein